MKKTRFIGKLGNPKRIKSERTAGIEELDTYNTLDIDIHTRGLENEYTLEYISYRSNSKSKYTVESDITSLLKWEKYVLDEAKAVDNIEYYHIHNLCRRLAAEDYTASSISTYLSDIRMFHRWMNDVFGRNLPTFTQLQGDDFTRNHTTRSKKSVSKEEIAKMVDAADNSRYGTRNALIILLFVYTGLRLGELAEVTLSNVDLDEETIVFTREKKKNYEIQTGLVKIHEDLDWLLETWISVDRKQFRHGSESEYLFVSERRGKVSENGIYNIVHEAAIDAGILKKDGQTADGRTRWNISPHSFRHSFSDLCRDQGLSKEEIASLLGHENISTTDKYGDTDGISDAIKSYDEKFEGIGN